MMHLAGPTSGFPEGQESSVVVLLETEVTEAANVIANITSLTGSVIASSNKRRSHSLHVVHSTRSEPERRKL